MDNREKNIRGLVYGDMVGAPFRLSGTPNRYFDLGQSRSVQYHGHIRTFHPQAGEPSFAAYAVMRWLAAGQEEPDEDALRRELRGILERHPRADWCDTTRSSLSSPSEGRTLTGDWAPLTRVSPIAEHYGTGGLDDALQATRSCVGATCRNGETMQAAMAIVEAEWQARRGEPLDRIRSHITDKYGLDFTRPLDDLSAMLQGKILEPMEMLGVPTGAYRYVTPDQPLEPSPGTVAEAALRCVFDSDGWEDAVRRAVSLQGPSAAIASIAGAFAVSAGMEIAPQVQGKLSAMFPMDIDRDAEHWHPGPRLERSRSLPEASSSDIVETVFTGFGPDSRTAYVVPDGRDDIMTTLRIKFADRIDSVTILKPSEVEDYIRERTHPLDETTHEIVPRPRKGYLYLQNGKLVSASEYVAPGMPPLQARKASRDAYRALLSYTISVQKELNSAAGYHSDGQIHYEHAYHPVISRGRIDFYQGNLFAGAVCLDGRGLLKVIHGDLHDIGNDADVSEYRNAEWCRRTIFSRMDALDPVGRVQQMKESIGRFILDEGVGTERFLDGRGSRDEFRVDYRKDDEEIEEKHYAPDIPNLDMAADDIASSTDPKILQGMQKQDRVSHVQAPVRSPDPQAVVFSTTADSGYAQRTRDNAASSDLTLAFAVDFTTKGETLTACCAGCRDGKYLGERAASGNSDRYVPCPWERSPEQIADSVEEAVKQRGLRGVPLKLNIAGNGLYTFARHKIGQDSVDTRVRDTLIEIQKRGIRIRGIRSGGQSGADEAGAKAGMVLGIPTEVHAPRGYRFRDERNRDICDEERFKRRFGFSAEKEEAVSSGALAEGQAVRTIYTIGHSNQPLSEFIAKLQAGMVDTVISLRSIGRSSYCPQFDNGNLLESLSEYGISFLDAGESLGGRQLQEEILPGKGFVRLDRVASSELFDKEGRVDWEQVRKSERFQKTFTAITQLMDSGHMVALMCSEADPLECHRLGMVGRHFSENGYEVLNILRNGTVESMEETEVRMVENYVSRGLVPDSGLFRERRELAYRVQNRLKGWRPEDMIQKKWKIRR